VRVRACKRLHLWRHGWRRAPAILTMGTGYTYYGHRRAREAVDDDAWFGFGFGFGLGLGSGFGFGFGLG